MKVLQPTEPDAKEVVPLSDDYSFGEPKATGKSLQMQILDPVHQPEWDHLVALHRDAGCFHTSAWAKVLYQSYGHQPFYLHFSCGRRLVALIPLMEVRSRFTGCRGVCLPFSDMCEPLIFDREMVSLVKDRLLHFTRDRRWKYLEIRGGESLEFAPRQAANFYGHTLDLRGGLKGVPNCFTSPVRRAIRKAERSGVSARVVRNCRAIDDFYRLHVQTRRRHGLPPQPISFFLNIYEHIIKPGFGFIVLAHRGSRPIASAIFFRFGRNAVYKFGASDKKFQGLRANNLVMWRGIQFLVRAGAERLHFGRTECENDGLRQFKLSWGTEEETIRYFRVNPSGWYGLGPPQSNSGFHTKIFELLPLAVNRLAGSIIYPHLD